MAISYTKLRSGNWGVRSTSQLLVGSTVSVVKRSGDSKSETVGVLVWSGQGVWLYAIASVGSQSASRGVSRGRGRYAPYAPCEGWASDNPHAPRSGHCSMCADM